MARKRGMLGRHSCLWEIVAFVAIAAMPVALRARPIMVDGVDTGDWDDPAWPMDPPALANLGHIGRDPGETGEYIWVDALDDERNDFGTMASATFSSSASPATPRSSASTSN